MAPSRSGVDEGMDSLNQETVAFGIVALVAGYWGLNLIRAVAAEPVARYLLRKGQVKWAMRWMRIARSL
jgi:hypothetical protein